MIAKENVQEKNKHKHIQIKNNKHIIKSKTDKTQQSSFG